MQLLVDNREKSPYQFQGGLYGDVVVTTVKLETGDYSVKGCENFVACERKSIADLIQSISSGRERFERELMRSRSLEAFCVVIEGTWSQIASGQYRSQMTPLSATQTLLAFSVRYRCNFLFAGGITQGEYMVYNFLRHYINGKKFFLEKLQRAMG